MLPSTKNHNMREKHILYNKQYMLFLLTGVNALRRLIGYSMFCIALGILITLFIESTVLLVILAGALLLIGYQLFCC